MTNTMRAAVLAAVALFFTADALAQPAVSLTPAHPARWDVAVHAGWFGSNQSAIAPEWDRWYGAGAGGVTVGRYWTPHLKVEIQGTAAGSGRIYTFDPLVPWEPQEHDVQASTLHAGVAYQFFENQWFHPFAGGGLEVVRERHRVDIPQHIVPTRDPVPVIVPGARGTEDVSYAARPFVDAGFKWFVSDRAFIRTELATSIAGRGFAQTVWSAGAGVEF